MSLTVAPEECNRFGNCMNYVLFLAMFVIFSRKHNISYPFDSVLMADEATVAPSPDNLTNDTILESHVTCCMQHLK